MFSVDGIRWPWPCDVTREARVTPSRISGLMLDGSYFNDVLGTYMSYAVSVAVPADRRDAYARLYEVLTDPVDAHRFTLPYNQGELELTGRVDGVSDEYVRGAGGETYWRGVRFTVTANHPSKSLALGRVLAVGRAPFPQVAEPGEGACYTYQDGQWVETTYADGDEVFF